MRLSRRRAEDCSHWNFSIDTDDDEAFGTFEVESP